MDKEKALVEKINRRFRVKGKAERKRIWIKIRKENMIDLCWYLKKHGFEHLSAISVTDFIKREKFEIAYIVWSYHDKIAIIVKSEIERGIPVIPSVTEIWNESAQIHERELHELFGVEFKGNPDLSELFLENWKGPPPFRKDFNWREYVRKRYYNKQDEKEKVYMEERI